MFVATELASPRLFRLLPRPRPMPEYASLPPFEIRATAGSPTAASRLDLSQYKVGQLSSVYYVPDYLSEAEQEAVAHQLEESGFLWSTMRGRRVQECGSSIQPGGAALVREALPPWLDALCARLLDDAIFPRVLPPNHATVNEYSATQGIAAHADGPIYGPRVAIISLCSSAVFYFYGKQPTLRSQLAWDPATDTPAHRPDGPPVECLVLRPGSLLLFSGAAFHEHCHEVRACADAREVVGEAAPLVNGLLAGAAEGETVSRERRVSITVRHLLDMLIAREPVQ